MACVNSIISCRDRYTERVLQSIGTWIPSMYCPEIYAQCKSLPDEMVQVFPYMSLKFHQELPQELLIFQFRERADDCNKCCEIRSGEIHGETTLSNRFTKACSQNARP